MLISFAVYLTQLMNVDMVMVIYMCSIVKYYYTVFVWSKWEKPK